MKAAAQQLKRRHLIDMFVSQFVVGKKENLIDMNTENQPRYSVKFYSDIFLTASEKVITHEL